MATPYICSSCRRAFVKHLRTSQTLQWQHTATFISFSWFGRSEAASRRDNEIGEQLATPKPKPPFPPPPNPPLGENSRTVEANAHPQDPLIEIFQNAPQTRGETDHGSP